MGKGFSPKVTGLLAQVNRDTATALVFVRGEHFIVSCATDLPHAATIEEVRAFSAARRRGDLLPYSAGTWPFCSLRERMLPMALKVLAEELVLLCLNAQLPEVERRKAADGANVALSEWDVPGPVLGRLTARLAKADLSEEALTCAPSEGPLRGLVDELSYRLK